MTDKPTYNIKDQVDKIKQQQDAKVEGFKNISINPKELLKLTPKNTKKIILAILTPVLLNFIRRQNVLKANINKLKKQLKKQLVGKGSLTIVGNTFIFTPNNYSDYSILKQDFDKKVNNAKKLINTLNQILAQLQNILKFLNIALSILQTYILIKTKVLLVKKASVIADLAAPSPSKTTAPILFDILKQEIKLQNSQEQIGDYQLIITAVQQYIKIFKNGLNNIKIELNQLQLTIKSSQVNTSMSLSSLQGTAPENEEYTDMFGKTYILKLVVEQDGSKQYQALDSFSKLKITQTALSKLATEEQLLEEIKQILG